MKKYCLYILKKIIFCNKHLKTHQSLMCCTAAVISKNYKFESAIQNYHQTAVISRIPFVR